MKNSKKVLFTGGGSAGHVLPNVPIIKSLKKLGFNVIYVGTANSPEYKIITTELIDIPFHIIKSDKLRRYFDFKNFLMPFSVLKGILQSINIIKKEKPDLIFSKGGYASLPVIFAARLFGIKIISHESDVSIGLTNRLALPFINVLCTALPKDLNDIVTDKQIYTGIPLRKEFFNTTYDLSFLNLSIKEDEYVILIFGGSLGAKIINETIKKSLIHLKEYTVIHIVGKDKMFEVDSDGVYIQLEYVSKGMSDLLKRADLVICRAGMTTIFELIALKKQAILIPLSSESSRGDQIENAEKMRNRDVFEVIQESDLNVNNLVEKIEFCRTHKKSNFNQVEIEFTPLLINEQILKLI